jgi:steroid delta-isomerase
MTDRVLLRAVAGERRPLPEFYSADAYFKDPFNEVRGVAAIQRIFAHMFEQVAEPRFVVSEKVVDDRGAVLIWTFTFRAARWGGGRTQLIRGVRT